jgi:hypothetical protein
MTDLPYWKVKKRIATLLEFIEHWNVYQEHSSSDRFTGSFPDDEEGSEARVQINLLAKEVSRYLSGAGCYPIIVYREPPVVGGRVMNIDVMENLFRLDAFEIPFAVVNDYLQRAIGYYRDDLFASVVRTFNPLWWIWRLLRSLIIVPFAVLDWAGYDRDRAEKSTIGRLFKFLSAMAIIIAGIVGFLDAVVQLLINLGIDLQSIPFFEIILP